MKVHVIVLAVVCVVTQGKLVPLSCKEIKTFVDGHNQRRYKLVMGKVPGQPAATDMRYMTWDTELAAKAAKWATRNTFSHNPNVTVASGRFSTGENLYKYSTTNHSYKLNVDDAMKSWFKEHKDFTYGRLQASDFSGSSGHQIGHYTQMAWAKTKRIGCAKSEYEEGRWENFLVVCNYGPAGNYLRQYPYSIEGEGNELICDDDCTLPYGDKC